MAKREYIQRHLLIIKRLKNRPSSFEDLHAYLLQQQELTNEEAMELATNYPFSGGEIDNIVRKYIMENVLHGERPSFEAIISFCNQEKWEASTMGNKIGY